MSKESKDACLKAMKAACVMGCDPYNSFDAAAFWYERQARFVPFRSKKAR
jgi:hypothetical protein